MSMDFKSLNETDISRLGTQIVYDALPSEGVVKIRASDILGQNSPYDILWNNNKLSVRVANISNTSRFPKWNYTVASANRHMVDFYILLTLKDSKLYKLFVLPPDISPETTITITERMGHMRYAMFMTELKNIPAKIEEVKSNLDSYRKLYREAKE